MKKVFFAIIMLAIGFGSSAQVKLGLKASPNLSWNRVIVPQGTDITGNGVKMRFGGGAFLDFEFSDNYAISTGITYTTKGAGTRFKVVDTTGTEQEVKTNLSLQYLEIPLSIKLFTNEIGTDMRLYFQVGATANINLAAKVDGEKSYTDVDGDAVDYRKNFSRFDLSALASAGLEMQMGSNTWFLIGLSYNRGLINADSDDNSVSGFEMYSEYVALDVGLKF